MPTMKISIPSSPQFQNSDRKDIESSTTPYERPLTSLSSSSGSPSFEELEDVPILPDFEAASPHRSRGSGRRRRTRFTKPYQSCIAFLALAYLSYFVVRKESATGQNPHSLSITTEIQNKDDQEGAGTAVLEPSLSSRVSPSQSSSRTFSPTPKPSPSAQPITKAASPYSTSKATEKPDTANNDIINRVKAQKKKNNLVLHIGPQKTGSTTLQDAWTEWTGVLSQSLTKDNYRYRFIHPSRGFFRCELNDYGGYVNCESSPKLKGLIRKTKNDGKNLLLSDENLDDGFAETLRDVIDDDDWDVIIDGTGHPYRKEHTLWPDQGGHHIPTFSSWYKEFTQYWDSSELVSKHRSIAFMNAYKPYFKNIVVHNMHQDGDLMTNFMCDSVPDARHSCDQLKSQTNWSRRDNQSVNLEYDILAVKAREKSFLMTSSYSRKEVGSKIGMFIKKTKKQIPRVCDINMIDEIRNWLLDSEKAMFHETWSDEKASELKLSFDSSIGSGKICDIDFDQVFADEEWLHFFKSLDNRPHLVIHVGPQKTGSTTLQHVWGDQLEMRNALKQDNFDYHFINPHRGMFDCDLDGDRWANCKVSGKLLQILSNARTKRRNLILSDENLDHRFAGALREAINDKHFRVKVVLVYRRIHRWLPSWYSQINKTGNMDSKGNLLRNKDGQPERRPHTKWPSEGGVYIPNFSDWYKTFVDHFHSIDLVSNHPSISFKDAYKPYFDQIKVYDIDQEGDLVTNFMCQMIPGASKTCHRLKLGSINLPALSNPSVNLDHDILSVQAYEHGLIDERLSRPSVVEEVKKHLQNSGMMLPRKCDSEVRDQIHDWLLDSEQAMFPDAWSPSTSDALDSQYTTYYAKGKLCDIDIETVLSDEAWIRFFSSL